MFEAFLLSVLILDLIIPFFIAIPYHGYSHTRQVMSVLGCRQSPWHGVYNVWMVFSGIMISLFGCRLFIYYRLEHFGLSVTLLVLMLLYGVGDEVISGFFPINERKGDVSMAPRIHGVGSVLGFMALQFAPLILSIISFKSSDAVMGWVSSVCFTFGLAAFVCFIMGDKPQFKDTAFSLEGLWQRLVCLFLYVPFMVWLLVR